MHKQLTVSNEARNTRKKKLVAVFGLLVVAIAGVLAIRHAVAQYNAQKYLESYGQTAISIGKYTVTYDVYRYFYCNYRDELAYAYKNGDSVDTVALDGEVRERVADALCGLYGTVSLADDYGITLSDGDVTSAADTYIDAVKNYYKENDGDYAADLAANYMTDSVFSFLMHVDAMEDKLFSVMVSDGGKIENEDEKLLAILHGEDFVRAKLIFIENDDGEDVDANRKIAEEALAAYKDGTDFDTLIGRYSEDYAMPADGYYFTHMEMIDVIEDAAFSMADGEISPVLECEDGFYLLLRLPKEEDYITENFTDLKDQYQSAVFYGMIEDRAAQLTAIESEYVRGLSYEEIR